MRINLLPPEIVERQRARRLTIAVIAVGLIVLVALGGFYLLQTLRLQAVEEDIAAQEAENARLRERIAGLQDVDQLQRELERSRRLVQTLLADRVLWSGILRDISLVIPGQTWLSGLTGSVGAPAAAGETAPATPPSPAPGTPETAPSGLVGQISFNGFAFEHRDVALWLSRLEDVRGFVNPWLSNSQKTLVGTTEVVQFTNSVDLSEQALARRAGEGS